MIRYLSRILSSFSLLLVILPYSFAGPTALKISVLAFGKPAAGTFVSYGKASDRATGQTDTKGIFTLEFPEAGEYHLQLSLDNCRHYYGLVRTEEKGGLVTHTLELLPVIEGLTDKQPLAPEELLEVVGQVVRPSELETGSEPGFYALRRLTEERMEQFRTKEKHFRGAADKGYAEGSVAKALESYKLAAASWPEKLRDKYTDQEYYARMITECQVALERDKEFSVNYDLAIRTADQFYKDGDLANAEKVYRQALGFKPNAPHPTKQLEVIAQEKQVAEANRMLFDMMVASAEQWERQGKYTQAIADYEQALNLMPKETSLNPKIEELRKKAGKLDQDYRGLIATADRLRDGRNYEEALTAYREARKLKPDEAYPMEQIRDISGLLQGGGSDAEYVSQVARADRAFEAGRWKEAEESYTRALAAKPGDEYARQRRDEASRSYKEEVKVRERFEQLIAEGDEDLDLGNAADAVTSYKLALEVIPGDKQATDKLSIAEGMLKDQQNRSARLTGLLQDARTALAEKDAAKARGFAEEARVMAPEDREVKKILSDVASLEGMILEETKRFEQLMAQGRQSEQGKQFTEALNHYRSAQALRPADKELSSKISSLETLIQRQEQVRERERLIGQGESFMQNKSPEEAIRVLLEAQKIEDGEDVRNKLTAAYSMQSDQADKEQRFNELMSRAKAAVQEENWESGVVAYTDALKLKPEHPEAKKGLEDAQAKAKAAADRANAFRTSFAEAGEAFREGELMKAQRAIGQALSIDPSHAEALSLKQRIDQQMSLKAAEEKAYGLLLRRGDSLLSSGLEESALEAFRAASQMRPDQPYPADKVSLLSSRIDDRKRKEEEYASHISRAASLEGKGELAGAILEYEAAVVLKPTDPFARTEADRLTALYAKQRAERNERYTALIAEADKAWQRKVIDEAMQKYREAQDILPEESYPVEMIATINRYLDEHMVIELSAESRTIQSRKEERFNFKPLDPKQRKTTYVLLSARNSGTEPLKVYLNYGKGNQKNGGIVFKAPADDNTRQFIIRVSSQYKWYDIANDWIGIYPEGESFEIVNLKMATGD